LPFNFNLHRCDEVGCEPKWEDDEEDGVGVSAVTGVKEKQA
jgi:hypothetical protein